MFYSKNLPMLERSVRLFAALAMGLCAMRFWGTPVGFTFGAAAVVAALTSAIGFCPMCAMAGRRIAAQIKSPN